MPRILAFLVIGIISMTSFADVIVKKDGSSMTVYNVEIAADNVYYTLTNVKTAPIKKIPVSQVFGVKIGNGELATLTPQPTYTLANRTIKCAPDLDNAAKIAAYSNSKIIASAKSNEIAAGFWCFWAFTKNSVLSTKDMWIEFVRTGDNKNAYDIYFNNKTEKPLYVDLAQCFRYVRHDSITIESYMFYHDNIYATNSSSALSSSTTPFGMINIGPKQSQQNGTSAAKYEMPKRILCIPPYGRIQLPNKRDVGSNGILNEYQMWFQLYYNPPTLPKVNGKDGELLSFQEDELKMNNYFIFSYSDSENFKNKHEMRLTLYIKNLIGVSKDNALWKNIHKYSKASDNIIISYLGYPEMN